MRVSLAMFLLLPACAGPHEGPALVEPSPAPEIPVAAEEVVVELHFVRPPAELSVGASHQLEVEASGDRSAKAMRLQWSARPESVLRVVKPGQVEALAPGKAWVTVASPRAEAVVEILVVE